MRIALGISYNGANYKGWQRQPKHLSTVQAQLEVALGKVAAHPLSVVCAGRTDAGVHALGQVIHFDTSANRQPSAWLLGTNTHLPTDIRVNWAQEVPDSFHARFSAQARSYRYIIYNNPVHSAVFRSQVTWYRWPLDIERMQKAACHLIGTHDFTSYRAMGCQAKSPIRTVHHLTLQRSNQFIFLDIKANAFLHHMVRNITGVLMMVGTKKHEPEWALEVLQARDRTFGGITAPPAGLYLTTIDYPPEFNLSMTNETILQYPY